MKRPVLFIHGGGTGTYAADCLLADSLQRALGHSYNVHCPQMPDEENSPYPAWKAEIDSRLASLKGTVAFVGHSVRGSVLLKYLCDQRLALMSLVMSRAPRSDLPVGAAPGRYFASGSKRARDLRTSNARYHRPGERRLPGFSEISQVAARA
jgi:pimeloyl-ACP methyl ester carboxylesterase